MSEPADLLTNKTILIVSPQDWGKMFVSKHHYAVELAKRGNKVFFLNPPGTTGGTGAGQGAKGAGQGGRDEGAAEKIRIEPSGVHEDLFLISHRLSFPYNIKFHFIGLFHWLMKPHIKRILRQIGRPIDIVWSFDLGHLYPFSFFPKDSIKVFHPVDEPLNKTAIDSAKGCQIIFSVTREILDKYSDRVPRHFINHGVSGEFLQPFRINTGSQQPARVGFSGNLLREDTDRAAFLQIVRENPDIIFECWGSYKAGQSNIGGGEKAGVDSFIGALQENPHCILHGVVDTKTLARELQRMDAFLICYDIRKDQSKGTNYHKVMEYISRGKVIISNNITTYANEPDLISMTLSREGNEELPRLFKTVMGSLSTCNSLALQEKRINYARENSYSRQLDRISHHIREAINKR